jgi:hypothetical protein
MSEFANDRTTWAGPDKAGPTVLNSVRPEELDWKPFAAFPPAARLAGDAKRNSGEPRPQIIHRERKWFEGAPGGAINIGGSRISASRWVGHAAEPCEQESEIEADCHVIGVALRPMTDVTLFAAGKLISTGHMPRGSMRVNEPGLPMRGIFRGAYDVLHLHVPNAIIVEYASSESGHARSAPTDRRASNRGSGDRKTGALSDPR